MTPTAETYTVGSESYFFLSTQLSWPLMMFFVIAWQFAYDMTPYSLMDGVVGLVVTLILISLFQILLGEIDKFRVSQTDVSPIILELLANASQKLEMPYRGNVALVNTHRQVLTVLNSLYNPLIVISPPVQRDIENKPEEGEIALATMLNRTRLPRRLTVFLMTLAFLGVFWQFTLFNLFIVIPIRELAILGCLFLFSFFGLIISRRQKPKFKDIYGKESQHAPQLLMMGVSFAEFKETIQKSEEKPKRPLKLVIGSILITSIVLIVLISPFLSSGGLPATFLFPLIMVLISVGIIMPCMIISVGLMTNQLRTARKGKQKRASEAIVTGGTVVELDQAIRKFVENDAIEAKEVEHEMGRVIVVVEKSRQTDAKLLFQVHSNLLETLTYPDEVIPFVISRILQKKAYKRYQLLSGLAIIPFFACLIVGFFLTIVDILAPNSFSYMLSGILWGIILSLIPSLLAYRWYRKMRQSIDELLIKDYPALVTALEKLIEGGFAPPMEEEGFEKRLKRLTMQRRIIGIEE